MIESRYTSLDTRYLFKNQTDRQNNVGKEWKAVERIKSGINFYLLTYPTIHYFLCSSCVSRALLDIGELIKEQN